MPRKSAKPKPKKKPDSKQYARFLETARAVGADEDPKTFDRAFMKVAAKS